MGRMATYRRLQLLVAAVLLVATLLGAGGAEAARSLPAPAPLPEPTSFSAAELLSPAADNSASHPFRLVIPELFSYLTSFCSVSMTHRTTCTMRTADFRGTPEKHYRLFLSSRPDLLPTEGFVIWKLASGVFDKSGGTNVWETGCLVCVLRRPTFQGLWTDPVTGLSYARNRWYDARTASWLSTDPLGAVDSQNLYAFVGHSPHMGTDPMGLVGGSRVGESLSAWLMTPDERAAVVEADRANGERVMGGVAGVGELSCELGKVFAVTGMDTMVLFLGSPLILATPAGEGTKGRLWGQAQLVLHPVEAGKALWQEQKNAVELIGDLESQGKSFEASALAGKKGAEWALVVIGGAEGAASLVRLGRSIASFDVLGSEFSLRGMKVMPEPVQPRIVDPGSGTITTPWGTRDLNSGKFTRGPRAGVDPVDDFVAQALENGYEVLGVEVSFKTPFGTRRVDVIIRDPGTGRIGAIEIKSSPAEFAKFRPEQFAADRYINSFGATAVGENAAQAGVRQIEYSMKIMWEAQ